MAKSKGTTDLETMGHGDLLYAVRSLVRTGRTTAQELLELAAERTTRIEAIEAELGKLMVGEPVATALGPVPRKRGRAGTKPATRKVMRPVGSNIVRKDGRKFTVTAAVRKSRKLQGQYLGHLRKLPEGDRPRFSALAKEKGVAAVLAAIKKHLGEG